MGINQFVQTREGKLQPEGSLDQGARA
jgi:hypothetical protein